jgi:two-component system NtrC family response regulator
VENRSAISGFAPGALEAMEACPWPGNVREMENRIRRAVIMSDGPQIGVEDLGLPPRELTNPAINLREVRDAAEYKVMVMALARADGNIVKAASMLGVSRPTLYDLMHHHGVKAQMP